MRSSTASMFFFEAVASINTCVAFLSMMAHSRAALSCEAGSAYLNSFLSARAASLAVVSFTEARSQSSRTRPQSSELVAVICPTYMIHDEISVVSHINWTTCALTYHSGDTPWKFWLPGLLVYRTTVSILIVLGSKQEIADCVQRRFFRFFAILVSTSNH